MPIVPGGFNCLASVQLLYARFTDYLARRLGYESEGKMFAAARRTANRTDAGEDEFGPYLLPQNVDVRESAMPLPSRSGGIQGLSELLGLHTATWVADSNLAARRFRVWTKFAQTRQGIVDGAAWRRDRLMRIFGDTFAQVATERGWEGAEAEFRSAIRAAVRETDLHLPRNDSVVEVLEPGDIVTAWYPNSDYRENYVTHILICLGKRYGEPVFAEQFGEHGRVTTYTDLVRHHHPFGIENVFRVFATLPTSDLPRQSTAADLRIEIVKSDRSLTVYADTIPLARYAVVLGPNPAGHKRREGDGRTPEGDYSVAWRNAGGSMGLDYPGERDALEGLKEGAIRMEEYARIAVAHRRGLPPPQNTALGGNIYIHGRADAERLTEGCIALTDTDLVELSRHVGKGTRVRIRW